MKATFTIEGLTYEILISDLGEFSFAYVSGQSKKRSIYVAKRDMNDLFIWDDKHGDEDITSNALPVYAKAGKFLAEWVYAKRPPRFGFSSSTYRKIPIYKWFAKKLAKEFPDYQAIEHPEGEFSFYRLRRCFDF